MTPREPMLIEVWSDIACPFCYIGKRRLEGALARFAHRDELQVQWRSFQLQPQLVTDATRRINEFLASSKGLSLAQVEQMQAHVVAMGAGEGIRFAMDRVVVANTFAAHRLLQFAQHEGRGDAMKDRLMQAYFTEGANVDDATTLASLAAELGFDRHQVTAMLAGDAFTDDVRRDLADARQLRISGVPFFLFDRAYAISGAQPAELFDQAIARAHSEWRAAAETTAP